VFLQLSEPSGPLQTQWHAHSHSHSLSTHLPLDSMCHTTFLLTKWVHLNSFSVLSTFWTIWTLANTTWCTVPVHLSSYPSSSPSHVSIFLPIPCVRPSSYSLNKFVWTHLVFLQLSEPSGPSQHSHSPPTHLPLDSMCHTTFLLTKRVRLNLFSVSSTFWTLWILANTMLGTVV